LSQLRSLRLHTLERGMYGPRRRLRPWILGSLPENVQELPLFLGHRPVVKTPGCVFKYTTISAHLLRRAGPWVSIPAGIPRLRNRRPKSCVSVVLSRTSWPERRQPAPVRHQRHGSLQAHLLKTLTLRAPSCADGCKAKPLGAEGVDCWGPAPPAPAPSDSCGCACSSRTEMTPTVGH